MANNKQLDKDDIDLLLEVNKKAIELQTEISNQYEEIIDALEEMDDETSQNKDNIEKIIEVNKNLRDDFDKLSKDIKEIKDSMFKTGVLISAGIVSIIIQIVEIFLHFKK